MQNAADKTDKKTFWRQLETAYAMPASEALLNALQFGADGLLPVITQCATTGQVIMLAWMNQAALQQTIAQGRMVYYSRSRRQLWRKGDTSGHIQQVISLAADCDGDAILAQVRQTGAACHTGRPSCFYVPLASPAPAK